ncbi:MAG: GNAT family N-acetyltransferase [Gammaproteobacteria bacterium]
MAGTYRVRPMRRDELDFAVELAAREGWNPGLHDADAFFAADPDGFLVGELDGTPIGCVSAVRYGRDFGFLGFYIVVPAHRGRGYGMPLWQAALKRLGSQNIGLDGVIEQQDNYRKSGFRFAYSNIRYEWRDHSRASGSPSALVRIKSADEIARYDRLCFPVPRRAFLDAWLRMSESVEFAWCEAGVMRGYGVIRRCREGWKIGPLFADTREIAEALLFALSSEAKTAEPIYLDVPEVNADAMRLAADYGMKEVFGTARMYNKQAPYISLQRIYGVTTFELG